MKTHKKHPHFYKRSADVFHAGSLSLFPIHDAGDDGELFPELRGNSEEITDKGLFDYGDFKMYVSAGLGNFPVALRFFNRPELDIITIEP